MSIKEDQMISTDIKERQNINARNSKPHFTKRGPNT